MRAIVIASAALLVASAACGDHSDANSTTTGVSTTSSSAGSGGSSSASGGSTSASGGSGGGGGVVGSPGCGQPEVAGKTNETLDVNGTERSYVIAIPDGLDGMQPVPLILGFHGFGGTGDGASNYFGLTGTEAAIYVYPQALPLPSQNNGIGWDMQEDGVDVAFIDALIGALGDAHCIDTTRVFAAGHSHGASFTNHLGCYRPATFRAIAPVAGGGPWAGPCSDGTMAAMLSHGTADMDVPISNGMSSRDHWLDTNGCSGAGSMPTTPSPCVIYDGCAEPVLWCEHGGGHEWPSFAGDGIRGFFLSF
jgi:poly(3-hydroxybutyrate) depolymerase